MTQSGRLERSVHAIVLSYECVLEPIQHRAVHQVARADVTIFG